MFSKTILVTLIALTLMPAAVIAQEEQEKIDWRKVKITCRRTLTKSKRNINSNKSGDTERFEHVTIDATVRNGMKTPIKGLNVQVVAINETAGKNRKDRKPVAGKEGKIQMLNIEPYKKVTVEAIKFDVSVRYETVGEVDGDDVKKRSTIKGQTYMGYVAFVKDDEGELLMVKAENSKIERIAVELGIIPKNIKLDRHGVVQYPEEDEK